MISLLVPFKNATSFLLKSIYFKSTVACILLLFALSFHTYWKQSKAKKRMVKSCLANNDTIFVALLAEHSSLTTAKCIFNLFENAACPRRVRIGLFQLEGDAVSEYVKLAEHSSECGISFDSQITVMNRKITDGGPYAALKELMQHCLKDSQFVLTLSDAVQLHKNWDKNMISSVSNNSVLVIGPSTNPSFTVLSTFEGGMPIVGWRSLSKIEAVAAKFWTRECSFALSAFWKKMKWRNEIVDAGSDVLITCDGLSRGWTFHHPLPLMDFVNVDTSQWTTNFRTPSSIFDNYREQLSQLNMDKSFKLSAMGIVNEKNEDEIITKYESRAEFLYIASKI